MGKQHTKGLMQNANDDSHHSKRHKRGHDHAMAHLHSAWEHDTHRQPRRSWGTQPQSYCKGQKLHQATPAFRPRPQTLRYTLCKGRAYKVGIKGFTNTTTADFKISSNHRCSIRRNDHRCGRGCARACA